MPPSLVAGLGLADSLSAPASVCASFGHSGPPSFEGDCIDNKTPADNDTGSKLDPQETGLKKPLGHLAGFLSRKRPLGRSDVPEQKVTALLPWFKKGTPQNRLNSRPSLDTGGGKHLEGTTKEKEGPGGDQAGVALAQPRPLPAPHSIPSKQRVLILFSGPAERDDGLAAILQKSGHGVDQVDLVSGTDLLDDYTFRLIFDQVKAGKWSYIWAAPPCSTFSRLRNHPGGQLR